MVVHQDAGARVGFDRIVDKVVELSEKYSSGSGDKN